METLVITGANRGIGLELTRRFLGEGARVVAGCRDPEVATELHALEDSDGSLVVRRLAVTEPDSVSTFSGALAEETVDVLINNAGTLGGDCQGVDDMDYGAWLEAFEVNTLAPFRLAMALRPMLLRAARPRIVTLSSQMGALARKSTGSYAYRSSKAAVNKVMQVLALELESDGIIACPVHPGWVRTDMGGPGADISVEESAAGLVALVNGLTPEHSGRFWTWKGEEHPW